jgi:tRNA (pseudouridine54-N1)-methyltransferase
MIEFILFSRKGRTDGKFRNLREAGRLDIVYQCLLSGFFISGAIRRDVIFHVVLCGPPKPPIHLIIDGRYIKNVRTDEETWKIIFKRILSGRSHPGIKLKKESFQEVVKNKKDVFVLEEKGMNISKIEFRDNPVFVLGDHIGLPKKDEQFALRKGIRISIGKKPYLASTCVDVINYLLDMKMKRS